MLTIDNPELEARLQERAERQGVPLDAYAIEVLRRDVAAQPERVTARSLTGKYAHIGGSVDDFLKEKHEENARETARGF